MRSGGPITALAEGLSSPCDVSKAEDCKLQDMKSKM